MRLESDFPQLRKHLHDVRLVGRMLLGPLAVGVFAGVELAQRGAMTAALGGYTAFVLAQLAVVFWGRWRLHRARRHLAIIRARRNRLT